MFTYAEAETILARLYRADESAQRGAFRGRLKHLKRLGIPLGSHPGKGKKIKYTPDHIFEWAFCLELEEFGLDPTVIVGIVKRYWKSKILPAFKLAGSLSREKPERFLFVMPQLMSAAWSQKEGDMPLLSEGSMADLTRLLNLEIAERCLVFSTTRVVRAITGEHR